jgi:cation diffusion facilitator CzcD-associated flavoprotein CzcO
MRKFFSTSVHKTTKACIIGGGPVGLSISMMLSKFKVPHMIFEK